MSQVLRKIVLEIDEDDFIGISNAIAKYQANQRIDGELILPDGEGDLRGRIIAEICRGWCDLVDWRDND